MPRTSNLSKTQFGRFKKEKNETRFKWSPLSNPLGENRLSKSMTEFMPYADDNDDEETQMSVVQETSLETLKSSTIQLLLKVDTEYSNQMTEKILEKIRKK